MRRLLALLICTLIPLSGFAWGPEGHRIVGRLAAADLRPQARVEVDRLLRGEPEPTLAGVSNWADTVRDNDPAMAKKTGPWHYVKFADATCIYAPVRDCPDGNCVIGAINRNFLILSDRKRPDAERRDALKYLVHFIGDVHQPLHASYRQDKGGNDFQIARRGEGSNLHRVWDSTILDHRGLDAAAYAAALQKQPPLQRDLTRNSQTPALDWAVESCRLIDQAGLYPSKRVIDDRYLDKHRPLVEQRLRQAGSRLAAMLNYALGR